MFCFEAGLPGNQFTEFHAIPGTGQEGGVAVSVRHTQSYWGDRGMSGSDLKTIRLETTGAKIVVNIPERWVLERTSDISDIIDSVSAASVKILTLTLMWV